MLHTKKQITVKNKVFFCDIGCIPLVKLFNNLGLKTISSCENNNSSLQGFLIIFDSCVNDEDIKKFINPYINKYGHSNLYGQFVKWGRIVNGLMKYNWIYLCKNCSLAFHDFLRFKEENKINE